MQIKSLSFIKEPLSRRAHTNHFLNSMADMRPCGIVKPRPKRPRKMHAMQPVRRRSYCARPTFPPLQPSITTARSIRLATMIRAARLTSLSPLADQVHNSTLQHPPKVPLDQPTNLNIHYQGLDSSCSYYKQFPRYIVLLANDASHVPTFRDIALQTALVAYTEKDPSTLEAVGGFAFPDSYNSSQRYQKDLCSVLLIHHRWLHKRSVMAFT